MCQTLLLQPLLVGCLLAASATMSTVQAFPQQAELSDHLAVDLQPSQTECPSCALLFSRVRARDGLLEQNVVLMERGEPKSGTGFMFEWAGGCLVHTCDYLRATFGEHSCSIRWTTAKDGLGDLMGMDFIFEPRLRALGGGNNHCFCEDIDRVSVSIRRHNKHELPLPKYCGVSHGTGIVHGSSACVFPDGSEPTNFIGLWKCMEKVATCPPDDDRQQMAVFRDPRPMAVSTYYSLVKFKMLRTQETVDEYVTRVLPTLCQWIAVRHILFEGFMADQSDVYWYEDALDDPLSWHFEWLASVGLHIPPKVVEGAASAAARHDFVFLTKGVDRHPGGVTLRRSYKDEITAETLSGFDAVLRTWLPPIVLARLGVAPA